MSQSGEAEPELRPIRLSRIDYVVDILKEKSNTDIRDTRILMLFRIIAIICLIYSECTVLSISCIPRLIELQKQQYS